MKSQWSDLPRRLATVSFGAPAIIIILSHRKTSIIFFQAVHILCTLEWVRLRPVSDNTNTNTNTNAVTTETTTDSSSSSSTNNRPAATTSSSYPKSCTSTAIFPILSLLLATSSTARFPVYLSLAAALVYLSYYIDADSSTTALKSDGGNGDAATTRTEIDNSCRHCLHGFLYLTTSFHSWLQLSSLSFGHTVYLLFIVWNSDTGALLGGRIGKMVFRKNDVIAETVLGRFAWGRRLVRFVGTVSPKKSFTGFAGGLLLGMWTAVFLPGIMVWIGGAMDSLGLAGGRDGMSAVRFLEMFFGRNRGNYVDVSQIRSGLLDFEGFLPSLPFLSAITSSVWVRRCVIGLLLSTCGIVGDMVESAVKRNSGKKDSGKLLPGHGGLLDRFDSTFFAVGVYFHLCLGK